MGKKLLAWPILLALLIAISFLIVNLYWFSIIVIEGGINMKNKSLLGEIWDFLKVRKAWWLAPIIIMLVLVGILIVFGQRSTVVD